MTKQELYDFLEKKVLVLDGATGTELQKRGMPKGICPEQWVLENPEVISEVQKNYIKSGSNAVYSCTFGANRAKLKIFGLEDKVYEMNKQLAEISKKAVGEGNFVAGDIAPTGKFVEPFGDLAFEDAVEIYKEQAKGLYDGGVDFFVIETMIDIQEMRAALIAIKEVCDLPVICSMTYSGDGFTLTGTDPLTALVTLQSLGAAVVGVNCSTGPSTMLEVIKKMKPYATVPLMAKPNAGLPKLVNDETVFDMSADDFGKYIEDFVNAGTNMMGGCCGTSPEYIERIARFSSEITPIPPQKKSLSAVTSARRTLLLEGKRPLNVIGERINPTGKKAFQAKLKEGKLDGVKTFAMEQEKSGADLLDVNMGMSGINESDMMIKSISMLAGASELPLVIDSSDPEVIERALRLYPGRALINSISAEKKKLPLLEVAKKYGAMFILLPLTDDEIPATSDGRIKVVNHIYSKAKEAGLSKSDIVVDAIIMTVSSDQSSALESLRFINWCSNDFGVNTTCGLSNVSFGLPQRKWVNSAFISMAIYNGLSMAIANPNEEILMILKAASDVLTVNDIGSKKYIEKMADTGETGPSKTSTDKKEKTVFDCIVGGDSGIIVDKIKEAMDNGKSPQEIIDNDLIPGINKVGDYYDQKKYFLPQLIAGADAMKTAFGYLEQFIAKKSDGSDDKEKVIIATVKGDIHDIGKNIVGIMLKNYGFDVIDLGKDISAEKIAEAAVEHNVKVVGLSALMTTTMTEMKVVIDLFKEKGITSKVFIGGAVITQDYADEINADGFARDSIEAVKVAKKLCGIA